MSNTRKFAQRELEFLVKSFNDPEDRPVIEEFIPELIALCDKFGRSGQSGGSAGYVASELSKVIQKLCLQQPICPMTGVDDEWGLVNDIGEMLYQNNRCSALFKDGDGRAWYLDAIVFCDQTNHRFTGSAILPGGDRLISRQYLRHFPFTPKTFYVDVRSKEIAKDDWEYYIDDEQQLDEVFDYYLRPIPKREVLIEKLH